MSAVLLEGIKELKGEKDREIEELKDKNKEQNNIIEELVKRVEQLEN
ncbi:MAG: hypothetical protein U9P50_02985 [Patescibacteria group bacterium]|nr:hypothetical protein [Patescibacteria group bacterium]